jgi:hypothetical protein
VHSAQAIINALRSNTPLFRTLAGRIMITTHAKYADTYRLQTAKLLRNKIAFFVTWINCIKKVTCLYKEVGTPLDGRIYGLFESHAQPSSPLY